MSRSVLARCATTRCTSIPRIRQTRSEYPSYNGDRIIVNKFAYDLSDPQRWDVVVFKYPEDAKTNYIKRLVGLPNERISHSARRYLHGPLDPTNFKIARKSPEKLRAMLQPVYDNDYVVPKMIEDGPAALAAGPPVRAPPWKTSADFKSFKAENPPPVRPGFAIRTSLPVPIQTGQSEGWSLPDGKPFTAPPPSLINDFYAYNDGDLSPGCPPAEKSALGRRFGRRLRT